jgi:hypothetical protein
MGITNIFKISILLLLSVQSFAEMKQTENKCWSSELTAEQQEICNTTCVPQAYQLAETECKAETEAYTECFHTDGVNCSYAALSLSKLNCEVALVNACFQEMNSK